jgi:hypothetical protein
MRVAYWWVDFTVSSSSRLLMPTNNELRTWLRNFFDFLARTGDFSSLIPKMPVKTGRIFNFATTTFYYAFNCGSEQLNNLIIIKYERVTS